MDIPLPKILYDVEAGGPLVTSLRGENELLKGMEELKNKKLQNQFYTPNIESEINNRNSLTKRNEIDNLTLNAKNILSNEYQKLQNRGYMPNLQSEIGLRSAQTNRSNQLLPLEAQELQLKNQAYPELIKSEISRNLNRGLSGQGVGAVELNNISREVARKNPQLSEKQIADATDAYLDGEDNINGIKLAPATGKLEKLLNQNYKRSTDQGERQQERFAKILETTFQQGDKVAPNAFKFAGLAGKTQGGIEALKAQGGENSPEYKDYLIFTRQILPAMASEILRTGGANSTDSQKLLAIQQANPIAIDNNPQLAMQQYEFLKGLYREIGKSISAGPSKTHADLNKEVKNNKTWVFNPSTGKLEPK